ncbi:MAG: serine protease [Alphaproteobacteria bacterium]|nr:serine protease [Alphaproteobacteria bacterium]
MKKMLLSLLLSFASVVPLSAIQPMSQKDDDEALHRGKASRNVCSISFALVDKEGKMLYLSGGSASLIKPNVVATAGHVIYDALDELVYNERANKDGVIKAFIKKLKKRNPIEDFRKQAKSIINKLKKGNPIHLPGMVTFEPDVHEALQASTTSEAPLFFEIDSVILHPFYDYEDCTVGTDLAFVRLKTPVEGIEPLSLYQEGIISPLGLHEELHPDLSMLIKAHFSGYGSDSFQRFGKKRTVSQLCFVEDESAEITGYVPSNREETGIEVSEETHLFHDALVQKKNEGDVYGLLHHGDSGGPLIVTNSEGKEFLIGIESTPGFNGVSCIDEPQDTKGFQDVYNIARAYETYLCPLFTIEGALRPEIPIMLEKLAVFTTSPHSYLNQIIHTEKCMYDGLEKAYQAGMTLHEFLAFLESGSSSASSSSPSGPSSSQS